MQGEAVGCAGFAFQPHARLLHTPGRDQSRCRFPQRNRRSGPPIARTSRSPPFKPGDWIDSGRVLHGFRSTVLPECRYFTPGQDGTRWRFSNAGRSCNSLIRRVSGQSARRQPQKCTKPTRERRAAEPRRTRSAFPLPHPAQLTFAGVPAATQPAVRRVTGARRGDIRQARGGAGRSAADHHLANLQPRTPPHDHSPERDLSSRAWPPRPARRAGRSRRARSAARTPPR